MGGHAYCATMIQPGSHLVSEYQQARDFPIDHGDIAVNTRISFGQPFGDNGKLDTRVIRYVANHKRMRQEIVDGWYIARVQRPDGNFGSLILHRRFCYLTIDFYVLIQLE
jgi:hypothetical protein